MTQQEALSILKLGHNVFLTGPAGSGKTFLLNNYIDYLKQNHVTIGVTASTGIAATHMGGMTIHAWSGLGIRDSLSDQDIDELESRRYLWDRLNEARVLIIDEVSMIHHFRLDIIDQILRSFRRNRNPFGGLQVILCGDFFQLPPISRGGEPQSQLAYHSEAWQDLNLKICYLEEQHRQNDKDYLKILNAIRSGEVSESVKDLLHSRFESKLSAGVSTTKLYSHNANVDVENDQALGDISGPSFRYEMQTVGRESLVETMKKGCLAPETLRLKKGARVMFVKNNFDEGYANGTLGVVADCGSDFISVRTVAGSLISVKPAVWVIEEDGKIKAELHQYPLRLAWAITIHKSQGMSLDAAEVDLSRSFEPGMGYVALSRVRSLQGLSLVGLNDVALRVNDEVLAHDEHFRDLSVKHAGELKALDKKECESLQNEFLASIAGSEKKKKVTKSLKKTGAKKRSWPTRKNRPSSDIIY